jgi:alpha-L-fucosidase
MNALRVVAFFVLIVVVVIAPAMAEELPARQEPGAGSQNVEPFNAEWASLERYECPEWFRDAKLGIYVHWGVYSVPARGCWYGRKMYDERRPEYAYHVDRFGHPSEFGYKDFIPMWKAERFDPDAWLTLFRDAGARYFTPCAVHHDGFDLWDSPHAFNSVKMGPKKNLIKMLKDATDRHGLRWGVTMHFARNYNFFQPGYGADTQGPQKGVPYIQDTPENLAFYHRHHGDTNPKYPQNPSEAWMESWSSRVADLVDRYDLAVLYFDGAIPFDIDDGLTGRRVLARYYNRGRERHGGEDQVVMTIKTARNGHGIYREGVATLDLERHRLDHLRQDPWQTDDTIGVRYWSYVDGMEYRSVDYLVDKFVDIVSKNGNLLLNVPPRADGTFDEQTIRILRELGEWNRRNGEAVFGTRPWIKFGEDDVRFTRSKDGTTLYATFLTWPEDGRAVLTSLAATEDVIDGGIKKVSLLGSEKLIEHRRDAEGLHLMLPQRTNELAVPVKIELEGRLSLIP